jgi:hypothetical protein
MSPCFMRGILVLDHSLKGGWPRLLPNNRLGVVSAAGRVELLRGFLGMIQDGPTNNTRADASYFTVQ